MNTFELAVTGNTIQTYDVKVYVHAAQYHRDIGSVAFAAVDAFHKETRANILTPAERVTEPPAHPT